MTREHARRSGKSFFNRDLIVLWFDKDSFHPIYEVVLLGTSGESRKYGFPHMGHLADSHQKRVITLEAGDRLDRYPKNENGQ